MSEYFTGFSGPEQQSFRPNNGEQTAKPYFEVFVPQKYENNPNLFDIQSQLELDPENTILVVGDQVMYFGGELRAENLENVTLPMPAYDNPSARRMANVKKISEDGRTIAFAMDADRAMNHIRQNQIESKMAS